MVNLTTAKEKGQDMTKDALINSLFTLCEEAIYALLAVGTASKRADVVVRAGQLKRQLSRLRGVAKEFTDGKESNT